jgi:signal transduction histidine kinase
MLFYQMRLIRMKKSKQRLECQVMARTRELQVSNQKLTEEMDRFSKVMSSLDLSIYVADINTYELLFVNKKIQDAFGDVEGKICWQSLQHGQTGPCPFCTNDKLLDDNGKPNPIYVWKFQNTITKKWYYIQNSAIKWRDGRWVRLEIATDITDIIHAEKELKEAKEKAESASRAKTLFLANMSHELRTPLNSILGFSQLVLQNPQDLSEHKDYLQAIHKSGEHLHQLISDILDIAKIEENYETLNERATDLHALISDIQKVMQVSIHNKDLTLHCHIENDLPVIVTIDNLKLSQVLINLINNAIKFTDKGDISLRLKSTPSSNHWVQLHFEIEDTGRGISEQDPNILFDTFQQSSESNPGEYEGIGLGLSICKKYIQMMGGSIWAKNNDKKGATFIFDIPAKRVETSGNKQKKYKKNQTIHFKADRAYNVLIADDHENNRRFLSEIQLLIQVLVSGKQTHEKYLFKSCFSISSLTISMFGNSGGQDV